MNSAGRRALQLSLIAAILGFAWLRFSDNTVDNDLWMHVLNGQRYWSHGHVRETEQFSWTATGFPVVNHEYLAEIVTGWAHRLAGGAGLFWYMLAMGAATVALAFRGANAPPGTQRWTTWLLFAASINFIALGFAVRPQLYTTLFLVVELILLRQLADGRRIAAFFLPPLFALWINFHGGVLVGVLLVLIFVATETEQSLRARKGIAAWPWGLLICSVAALLANPWGVNLIRWNIAAVKMPRPQIHEWQWMTLNAAHAPFYVVLVVSALGQCFSRLPRRSWETTALVMFATMGILHQRHAPLFGLANLVLSSRHVDDAARRFASRAQGLVSALARPAVQFGASVALLAAGGWAVTVSFQSKQHPFTMEVERNVFPVAATAFMREHRLTGKTITFFDWGQQNIWELPENPVSFDGRFDTGYPRGVIDAHWDLYAGKALRPEVNWSEAEVALLPADCAGIPLLTHDGWRPVYRDALAAVFVSARGRHAKFLSGQPMQRRGEEATRGRVPFPDAPAALANAQTR